MLVVLQRRLQSCCRLGRDSPGPGCWLQTGATPHRCSIQPATLLLGSNCRRTSTPAIRASSFRGKIAVFPSIWCLPCPVPAASCGPGWCGLLLSWASYRDTNKPRPRPAHTSRNTRGDISLHLGGGSRRRCRVNILWRCIDKSGITHRNNLQERSYFILYFHCLWSGCCWLGLFSKIINIICKVAL